MDIWKILTIVMAFVTVASLILALFTRYRPRKRQKLLYQTSGIQYFEEGDYALPSDVTMTFRGKKVMRLAKTTFILWNGGTDVLRGEDIIAHDAIRICLPSNGTILNHSIVAETNKANLVVTKPKLDASNELTITYEYLNPNDGVVIQVLHDTDQREPVLIGTAKGLSEGVEGLGTVILRDAEMPLRRRRRLLLIRFLFVAGLITALLGSAQIVSLIFGYQGSWLADYIWLFSERRNFFKAALIVIGGVAYMSLPFYEYWTNRRRYPRSLGMFLQMRKGESVLAGKEAC